MVNSRESSRRSSWWVWLLCVWLVWLSAFSPCCNPAQDLQGTVIATHHRSVGYPDHSVPDSCDRVCICCDYFGRPEAGIGFVAMLRVERPVGQQYVVPLLASPDAPFHPPRLTAS